jgi:hypothetical protein
MPRLTDRLPLGAGGLQVSPICIGIVADERVIPAAFEAGINFFFISADMHWPLYEATRRGVRELLATNPAARGELVLGVVAYVTQPEFCFYPFQEVLDELGNAERIDLTIAGGCYGYEIERRLPIYEQHRATGHVGCRAIGATFHDRKAALATVNANTVDIAYVRSNVLHAGAHADLFPHVTPRGAGRSTLLYNFKSTDGCVFDDAEFAALGLGEDYWRPHPTDYYRFAFSAPALDGILCALPAPSAVRELDDALAKGPLDDNDREYLIDLADLAAGRARLA